MGKARGSCALNPMQKELRRKYFVSAHIFADLKPKKSKFTTKT